MHTRLLSLVGTIIILNLSYVNSSSIKQDVQSEKQYWNEWLPIIKNNARETVKERFESCTNWLINLLESNNFYYKIKSLNRSSNYNIKNINDIIDMNALKQEINIRKILLNNINGKVELNGNAWSEIPLVIYGCNSENKRKIGEYLQWDCELIPNHWYMSFEKCYDNIKLNFYSSYEYQSHSSYNKNDLNSEQTLSVCLSGIEMDLLTNNKLTNNTELFANYLISNKDNCASSTINRYSKYLTKEQNVLLAKHILSYYLSFVFTKHNVIKYLLEYYLLKDAFKNVQPNKFLLHTNKVRTDDWFEVIIKKYLDEEFGNEYNKDNLESFKTMILRDKERIRNMLLPEFTEYTNAIFTTLFTKSENADQNKINNTNNIVNVDINLNKVSNNNNTINVYQNIISNTNSNIEINIYQNIQNNTNNAIKINIDQNTQSNSNNILQTNINNNKTNNTMKININKNTKGDTNDNVQTNMNQSETSNTKILRQIMERREHALSSAFYDGNKIINNIMSYVNFKTNADKKSKKKK